MAFNTNNPLGSTDPRDLSDNSENFDRFANGTAPSYVDRLGNQRKSFSGMESEFASFIAASGYEFVGNYAAGITITGYQQVVKDVSGEFWRLDGATGLPYTTTGAGLPEGGAFVAVGDAAIRQELNASTTGQGSDLVAHTGTTDTVTEALDKRTIYVGSVAENISGRAGVDGQQYSVTAWHAGGAVQVNPAGGHRLVYKADEPKSNHGKTGWSPTVPKVSEQAGATLSERRDAYLAGTGETDAAGSGLFVILQESTLSVTVYGAIQNGTDDDHGACQAATDFVAEQGGGGVYFPRGSYRLSSDIVATTSAMRFYGDGPENSALLVDGGVTGLLVETEANSAVVNTLIDHLEFVPSGQGTGITRGVRIRSNSRKTFISYCRMRDMDYGIVSNDSWTTFISKCHIRNNKRNIAIYRTTAFDTSATTVYIQDNSIMNAAFEGYSLSVGESGQEEFQDGEQCGTLIMRNNVMDGSHCYQKGAKNVHWINNHVENSRLSNQPFLLVEGNIPSGNQTFEGNLVRGYDFGVAYEGSSGYDFISVERNTFRAITHTAVRIPEAFTSSSLTERNTFDGVGKKYEFALRTSNREYAGGRNGFEDTALYLSGNRFDFATALPSSGRLKHGDQFIVRNDASTAGQSYFFEAGGNAATALGMTNINALDETGDTDSVDRTVTPTDITKFEAGDRLVIAGADTSGGDLSCVIQYIDYANGTFQTAPFIKTSATATTISFEGADNSKFNKYVKQEAGSVDLAAAGTAIITLVSRSTYLVHVRQNSNSNRFISAIIGTGLTEAMENILADNSNANFSVGTSGDDMQITNNSGADTFSYAISPIDSN